MPTYEQQTEKLLQKRQAVLERMANDKAEIEKINARLNELQLAKIRDALGCDEQELFELITKHPEQLTKLKQESSADERLGMVRQARACAVQGPFRGGRLLHQTA